MPALLNLNILTLTVMSMLLLSVYGQQDKGLCPSNGRVLCIKDVLLNIVNATKGIKSIIDQIEQHILQRTKVPYTLNIYANNLAHQMYSNLPTSEYHNQYMRRNNINKTDFINLIQEENYAFSYLYNSIKNIFKIEDIFFNSTDKSLKKILNILQDNILCNYRNILDVYSETWVSLDEINGIQILKSHKRTTPSFLHDSYSIIVTRVLRQWIERTNHIIDTLEIKLS